MNFKDYMAKVKGSAKNLTQSQDIDLIPCTGDTFTHTQNIKARIEFLNTMLSNQLWDTQKVDPINFLYEILINQGITLKDHNEYYSWIMTILESNKNSDIDDKIFQIFCEKICGNAENYRNLTIQAFDSYLKVFINVNNKANKIYLYEYKKKTKV